MERTGDRLDGTDKELFGLDSGLSEPSATVLTPPSYAPRCLSQPMKTKFPNSEQLHKDLQIRWSTHGPSITMELAAQIGRYRHTGADELTVMSPVRRRSSY